MQSLKAALVAMLVVMAIPALAQPPSTPHIIMISIDGMRPDYVTEAYKYGLKIPTLRKFISGGTYADGVTAVIPTVTYPSHTTLMTGVWSAEHGFEDNTTFDPLCQHPEEWYRKVGHGIAM